MVDRKWLDEKIEVSKGVIITNRECLKAVKLLWESIEDDKISVWNIILVVTLIFSVLGFVFGVINLVI